MPNFGASSIVGPGIGGGGSEIAAVSVGVYANNTPLAVGLQQAKREVAAVGVETATIAQAAGTVAGERYADGFTTGLLNDAKGLGKAKKLLFKGLGAIFVIPTVIGAAFKLGNEISDAITAGWEAKYFKFKKRVDDVSKDIQEQRAKVLAEQAKTINESGTGFVNPKDIAADVANIDKLTAKIDQLNRWIEDNRKIAEKKPGPTASWYEEQAYGEAVRRVQVDQKEMNQLIADRAPLMERINRIQRESGRLTDEEKKSRQEQEAIERRIAGTRSVAAERTATDISRMRALMEIQQRQRYGPAPGFGVQKGGWSR